MAEFPAEGRDIYGQGLTVRDVYEIEAAVRPGNSGGPLVEPDGTVIGVVFSRSTANGDVGLRPDLAGGGAEGGQGRGGHLGRRHRRLRGRLTTRTAAPCVPSRHPPD